MSSFLLLSYPQGGLRRKVRTFGSSSSAGRGARIARIDFLGPEWYLEHKRRLQGDSLELRR